MQLKNYFRRKNFKHQMAGIECRKHAGEIKAISFAYKHIAEVLSNRRDLVEAVAELKQIFCLQG